MDAPVAAAPPPPEEVKFPDRDMVISRMSSIERNSGAVCTRFVHGFRRSCFHFKTSVSHRQETLLDPPRSFVSAHMRSIAASYVYPKCFVLNNDLPAETRVEKKQTGEDVVKFEWKQSRVTAVGSDDEEKEIHASDDEAQRAEEDDQDDLIGEYNVAQYEDQETGEDADLDDGSDDND